MYANVQTDEDTANQPAGDDRLTHTEIFSIDKFPEPPKLELEVKTFPSIPIRREDVLEIVYNIKDLFYTA